MNTKSYVVIVSIGIAIMIVAPIIIMCHPVEVRGTIIGKYPEIGGFGSAHPNQITVKDLDGKNYRINVYDDYFTYNINDSINWTGKLGDLGDWSILDIIPMVGILLAFGLIFPVVLSRSFNYY